MWGTTTLWLAATILTTVAAQPGNAATPSANRQTEPSLQKLVEAFFLAADADDREGLIRRIEKAADGSIQAVARAVENASLWAPLADRVGTFPVESSGGAVDVSFRLPADYDPADSHPLVVYMPDAQYPWFGPRVLDHLLLDAGDRFVAIHPARPIDGSFHREAPAGVEPATASLQGKCSAN